MKTGKYAAAGVLLAALAGLPGCRLGLFDVVKREVEEYKLEQAGSPQIAVLKGIIEVPEGAEVPLGPCVAGEHKLVAFSIENHGPAPLQLTGSPRVQIGGTHFDQFSISTLPAASVAPGGKSDFTIDFYPIGLPGERTATLLIENNASGDGSFEFTIAGDGVGSAGPEIQVVTGSTVIDETPGYVRNFGRRLSGQTTQATFTIYNIGTPSSLLQMLSYPNPVSISGADAAMFSVVAQPDKQWLLQGDPDQDHTSFTVRYQPTAMGTHTATVSIANNDANGDETPYTFGITGTCDRLEVLFLVGNNGAMTPILPSAKAGIATTMANIASVDSNAAFALATTCDFPFSPWGQPGFDEAYDLLQVLTTNQTTMQIALNAIVQQYGNDAPASQLEALYQAATGEGYAYSGYSIPPGGPGWGANALKAIVLVTDFQFHNPETEGYPGHTFGQVIGAMNTEGIKLIGMSVGYNLSLPDLQTIAEGTGGMAFANSYYVDSMVMAGIETLMADYQ